MPIGIEAQGQTPLVTGSPAQTARLRPLRNPLFDTELMVAATGYTRIEFFVNRRTFLNGTAKNESHTNMTSDGQLGSPLEFDLIGLTGKLNYGASLLNINAFYNAGAFKWLFHQNVQWLNAKVTEMPGGVGPTGFTTEATSTIFNNGVGSSNNFFNMTDHLKQARHILPLENFKGVIDMPATFTPNANNVLYTVQMIGLLYGAL